MTRSRTIISPLPAGRTTAPPVRCSKDGSKGQAAASFGAAITAWFDVAVTIGPILDGYSQALVGLAQEHATTDLQVALNADRLQQPLGGGAP